MDTLSTMFSYALSSRILLGVRLGTLGRLCHLQYANDLIIFVVGGFENLHIINLILHLYEGITGLTTNFNKSHSFETNFGFQSSPIAIGVLNYDQNCLYLTYLGVPLSGR